MLFKLREQKKCKHDSKEKKSNKFMKVIGHCNYHTKLGPIWARAFCQPTAHIWGPSTAIAKGVRINRDNIDKQA